MDRMMHNALLYNKSTRKAQTSVKADPDNSLNLMATSLFKDTALVKFSWRSTVALPAMGNWGTCPSSTTNDFIFSSLFGVNPNIV